MRSPRISTSAFKKRYPELVSQIETAIRAAGGPWGIYQDTISAIAERYGVSKTIVTHLVLQMRWRERE